MAAVPLNYISLDETGVAYLSGTRMKVRLFAIETNQGYTPQQIQAAHPHLSLAQIHAALAYYYSHKEEIDAEIETANRLSETILAEVGQPIDLEALKERLRQGSHS